jgi:predicted DNA-binding transcriptional regulator AlpA
MILCVRHNAHGDHMANRLNKKIAVLEARGIVESPRDPRAYLTRDGLCERWGISRATSYRLEADGYLARPVRFGRGIARWALVEIEAIERRAAEDRA